ncbi:hypothetical protein Tco_1167755 [Tanacetum coccineum]
MKSSSMESRGLSNGKKVLKEPSMTLPLNDEIISSKGVKKAEQESVRELSSLVISPSPKVANGTLGKEVVKSNDRSELLEDLQKGFAESIYSNSNDSRKKIVTISKTTIVCIIIMLVRKLRYLLIIVVEEIRNLHILFRSGHLNLFHSARRR